MVYDKCASSTVERKSTRRCGGTSESMASELGDIVSGGTDGRDGERSSVRGMRGATMGRPGGSAAREWPGRMKKASPARVRPGQKKEEAKAHPPRTDQAMTWTSVGGDTMGDSDAEKKELVVGLLV